MSRSQKRPQCWMNLPNTENNSRTQFYSDYSVKALKKIKAYWITLGSRSLLIPRVEDPPVENGALMSRLVRSSLTLSKSLEHIKSLQRAILKES